MKLCRCPICHSDLHLEALIEDDAGRELLGKISQLDKGCASPLVTYLGLFKPAKSNLSNSRALKLFNEVLELFEPSKLQAHCLSETVQAVRKKRLNGQKAEPPKAKMQEDKTRTAIEYIERYALAGQLLTM